MGIGDTEKMILVGVVWGATNALMRRGAVMWESALRRRKSSSFAGDWGRLLLIWQYTVPFALNLSASAAFFASLGRAPISVAVPVTNATTFAATALFGALLGETTRLPPAFLGTSLILLGLYLCVGS